MLLAALLALSALAAPARSAERRLTILYTGDTYGVLGYPGFPGGLAARKAAIDRVRADQPNLLILDAGNAVAPFYFSRLDRGELTFSALEGMGYDALNLGSHEFDYGASRLLELRARYPKLRVLSSNIVAKASGETWAEESLVREVNGVTVGIVGLTDPDIESEAIVGNIDGLAAKPPEAALKELAARLRPKVQVLVVLSNLPAARLLGLIETVPEVDIAISRSAGGDTEYTHYPRPGAYDFRYFVAASSAPGSAPRVRSVFAYASRFGFELGRIDVEVRPGGEVDAKPRVIDLPVGAPEDAELRGAVQTRIASVEAEYGSVLLGGLRERLGRAWDKDDFLHMLLVMMRRASASEVAAINENAFFKLRFINDHIGQADRLAVIDLQHLFWTENHLVRQTLSGRQLRALVAESQKDPGLRLLGLSAGEGGAVLVNGRRVKDDEDYTVATSNYLASGIHQWATLRQGRRRKECFASGRWVLRDLVTRTLEAEAKSGVRRREWAERYQREKSDPYPAQWRLSIEDVSLDVSDLKTHTQPAFSAVRDARVSASDQFTLGTSGRLAAVLDHRLVAWKNDVQAAFSRVELPNDVVNNPVDSLVLGSQVDGQRLRVPLGGGLYAVPTLRAAYNTEFSPTPGNPRRKLAQLQPGFTTTLGGRFEELRLSEVTEFDLSTAETNTEHGVTFVSRFRKVWPAFTVRQEIEAFYFVRSGRDTADDLLWHGTFRHRVDVPIWGGLSLSPYVDVFGYRGKLIRATGWNVQVGAGLTYRFLWKPLQP